VFFHTGGLAELVLKVDEWDEAGNVCRALETPLNRRNTSGCLKDPLLRRQSPLLAVAQVEESFLFFLFFPLHFLFFSKELVLLLLRGLLRLFLLVPLSCLKWGVN